MSEEHTKETAATLQNEKEDKDKLVINEIQLILAEKRTSLATMRTGIAVFALPLSVLSILITTSNYYTIGTVLPLLLPLLALCVALIILGFYLVTRSILRLHHQDNMIQRLKKGNERLAEFID